MGNENNLLIYFTDKETENVRASEFFKFTKEGVAWPGR